MANFHNYKSFVVMLVIGVLQAAFPAFGQWQTTTGVTYTNHRVGISNSAPQTFLHVGSGTGGYQALYVNGRMKLNDSEGGIWLSNIEDGFVGNHGGNIGFFTNGTYPSGTPVGWSAFQIKKSNGFVGISTQFPNALVSLGSELADTKLALYDGGAGDMYGLGVQGFQFRLHLGNTHARFSFLDDEAGNELMTIKGNGSVGIGIDPPDATFKLSVNGKVRAREVKVNSVPWADYVFYPSYQLRTLTQVEAFIKANQHLPDVPSAAEVEKEGIDLGAMDAMLLKKIEELTLYAIEQNKKLEMLQQENQQQAQQIEQLRTKGKNKR